MKPASTTTASNSSINSIPSTTSDNMSLTSERSPFFSDSDDDSYQPGQEIGDFDLSHLDDLDQYNESDRFSNEDHEDVDEDDISLEAEALSYFTKLDKNGDGYIAKDELTFEVVLDQNNDGQVSDEEVNYYMSGHDNYDQETFLNTGWLLIKHLYSKFEKPVDNNEPTEDINTEPNDDVQDYDYDDLDDNEDEDTMKAPEEKIEGIEEDHDQAEQVSGYPPEVQALVDAANAARDEFNAARDEFNAANRAYNDANRKIQDLERYLSKDFGPDEKIEGIENDQVLDGKTKLIIEKMIKDEVYLHVHDLRQSIDDVTGIVWQIFGLLFAIIVGK